MQDYLARNGSTRWPRRTRARTWVAVASGVAFAAMTSTAGAVDSTPTGRQLLVKNGGKKSFKAQSKDPGALPLPASDPTVVGGSLSITLTDSSGAQSETFNLPAAGWKASGTPVKSYSFKGTANTPGVVRSLKIQTGKVLKASGTPATLGLSDAPQLTGEVVLTIGSDRYCLDFGTPANPNTNLVAKWGIQNVAGSCPAIPTTTTTTTPLPTTTTTTIPIACGNGVVQPGETCDDSNATPCDGCTNCQIDACGDGNLCTNLGEQCDDGNLVPGDGCNGLCETEGTTCLNPPIGSRLVVVSLNTPSPLAGIQLTLDYPQLLSNIPGSGTSSLVQSRVFVFPQPASGSAVVATSDNDTSLTTLVAAAGAEFINSGVFAAYDFDNCAALNQNVCNRAQTVVGCCNDPADPNQFGNTCARYSPTLTCTGDASCPVPDNVICTAAGLPYPCCTGSGTGTCTPSSVCTANGVPLGCCTGSGTGTCTQTTGACLFKCPANPPLCAINGAISNFSTTSVQPCAGTVCSNAATRACIVDADCVAPGTCTVAQPAGACPGDNACVPQSGPNGITSCSVTDPVDALGNIVGGVTCSVTVL